MTTTRRSFLSHTLPLTTTAALLSLPDRAGAASPSPSASDAGAAFRVVPVGRVEKEGNVVRLRLFDQYTDGLLGLEQWSHLNVFYWFDKNDTPAQRRTLRVHPRGNPKNPLTGVFACRAPVRPNLIALSVCRILAVQGNLVVVDQIDAFDATPIIDLKPFTPIDAPAAGVKVPAWAG